MPELGVRDILLFILAVVQAVGVKAAFRLADALNGIRQHLAALNGKVNTCSSLREEHVKIDDHRHDNVEERLLHLERKD